MVRQVWLGGGLLLASMGCSALSLGSIHGQALIGRPLDVTIPLTLGEGESSADVCASAQVFFADDAVSGSAVRSTVVGTPALAPSVRVQTASPLTETFARIELQVGCGQRLTRSYVLLADLAPASVPSAAPLKPTAPAVVSAVPATPGPSGASRPVARDPLPLTRSVRSDRASQRPDAHRAVKADEAKHPSVPVAESARLRLDPLELLAEASQLQPALRLTVDAPVESEENADLEQRRQAARLLWQTLNESPEQLAANALKAQSSDAGSAKIRVELIAAQQAAQAAQAQLIEEQDSRYTNPVFLGVLAALVASLLGLALLWRRQRDNITSQPPPWWKMRSATRSAEDSTLPEPVKVGFLERLRARSKVESQDNKKALKSGVALDIDVDTLMPEDSWPAAAPSAAFPKKEAGPSQAPSGFSHSVLFEGGRSVATEELFDLQQQVEFFISMGQADQAIEVLKAHLSDSETASPLGYLDLLKLYHELGRRDDYESLRAEFNQRFNGSAPDFKGYSTSRRGLERYESALSRIQALWPQPAVLQLIERSIFGPRADGQTESFDLEAYRDLLLLYGIAREVIESNHADEGQPGVAEMAPATSPPSVGGPDSGFGSTTMQPLPVTMTPAVARFASGGGFSADVPESLVDDEITLQHEDDALAAADVFHRVGLDLDLSLDEFAAKPEHVNAVLPPEPVATLGDSTKPFSTPAAPILDLDFSLLGGPETFTIKKSGKPV